MIKKIFFVSFIFFGNLAISQTSLKISDNTFIKLTNSSNFILSNPDVNPITKTGNYGGFFTQTENEKLIVGVGTSSGNFNIPFVSSVGNTIPFEYNITSSGVGSGVSSSNAAARQGSLHILILKP